MRAFILAAAIAVAVSSGAGAAVCRNPATGQTVACRATVAAPSAAVGRNVVLSGPVRARAPRCVNAAGRLGRCGPAAPVVSPPRTVSGAGGEPQGVAPLH